MQLLQDQRNVANQGPALVKTPVISAVSPATYSQTRWVGKRGTTPLRQSSEHNSCCTTSPWWRALETEVDLRVGSPSSWKTGMRCRDFQWLGVGFFNSYNSAKSNTYPPETILHILNVDLFLGWRHAVCTSLMTLGTNRACCMLQLSQPRDHKGKRPIQPCEARTAVLFSVNYMR